MFYQGALQVPIIGLHPFGSAPPGRDCTFGESLGRVGDHQFRITDQFRSETMTGRAGSEMAVEREMFRGEFAQGETALCVSVIRGIAELFPHFRWSIGVLEY